MQTAVGGAKASKTMKEKYGDNYYAVIGAKGGKLSRDGGFAATKLINGEVVEEGRIRAFRGSQNYGKDDY